VGLPGPVDDHWLNQNDMTGCCYFSSTLVSTIKLGGTFDVLHRKVVSQTTSSIPLLLNCEKSVDAVA
jgi:hypothetical protein